MNITGTITRKTIKKLGGETIMELGIYMDKYYSTQEIIIYREDLLEKLENISLDDKVSLEVTKGKEENILKLIAVDIISINNQKRSE